MINRHILRTKDDVATKQTPPLLQHVMNGDFEAANAYVLALKQSKPTTFQDVILNATAGIETSSRRRWESISPLAFAAWAGDFSDQPDQRYMLNMLLRHLPSHYLQRAIKQLQLMQTSGTKQFGEIRNMMSAFQPLDASYASYDYHFKTRTNEERDAYWNQRVGAAQRQLPCFALQEFCRPTPWKPMPDFMNLPAPPRHPKLAGGTPLFPLSDSGLGVTFALYHYGWIGGEPTSGNAGMTVGFNREVLRHLCETKKKQLVSIIQQHIATSSTPATQGEWPQEASG
tara:strand:+ start:1004 stop:1858 length:855 start_codon:yes stop_codon:yes gene_type:complete